MRRLLTAGLFAAVAALSIGVADVRAQGVTTAAISGSVTQPDGSPLVGATVTAVHEPSGTRYGSLTRADGRYFIPGMRVGGPYTVQATFLGYETQTRPEVQLTLGLAANIDFQLSQSAIAIAGVTVTAAPDAVFSTDRTGAATAISRETIEVLPTITGRIESVTRLTPQMGQNMSFAGQDNRLNNITVDGSYFNNSFGLAGQPGERTGVAPISLQAIEQVQVNIAPFDVRQGNFVGAGVNTVTRSGTNEIQGSIYHQLRNQDLVGTDARGSDFNPGTFDYGLFGGWLSGPIVENRLFFFLNYENEGLTEPGTTFRANAGGEEVGGSVTRVQAADLNRLSEFLSQNFGYETGPYEDYDHEVPATRFLGKLDFNLDERNRFSLRYNHLDSSTDVLASNSSSLGFGNRRTSTQALNFRNSNYQIKENIRSVIGEWNAVLGPNMANNLIVGYTFQDESRASRGSFFPFVDILEEGATYTSFGFEAFTPNNELRYGTWQLQNNFTYFTPNHTLTFGFSGERYESENVFFSGAQGVYTYNSLDDFLTDAQDYIANPNRTTSPVSLRRYQVRWANIPGMEKPLQPLEVFYGGIYGQDEWQVNDRLKLTLGARIDVPFFGETGFVNPAANALTFRDEDGNPVQYRTEQLPGANLLFSPRVGFNLDALGDQTTQVRGGTGIFTGRPAYVWISNQIGENGMLTGFEQLENTTARPFNPNPDAYKPTEVSGLPAASYGLAFSDPDFKFPQIWRTNLALDQRLPWGLIGTLEGLYSRDVNGVYYINANLTEANGAFTGVDDRPRWTGNNRVNGNISSAVVLKNQSEGYSWNIAGSLEKPFDNGLYAKVGASYGIAKNTVDPGSIAFGSWNNNQHAGDPNNPGLGYSANTPWDRYFGALSYRAEYFDFGATTFSIFAEQFHPALFLNTSYYAYSGDLNGDGGTSNDLIYIPRDQSEMNFQEYSAGDRTYTAAEQAAAWDQYIDNDPYLSENRGRYAERNAARHPMVFRADFSVAQEVFRDFAGRRNALEFRADVLNVGNLLNSDWGVSRRYVNPQPLIIPTAAQGGPADETGAVQYRLRTLGTGGDLMTQPFEYNAGIADVYRIQFTLRYTFN